MVDSLGKTPLKGSIIEYFVSNTLSRFRCCGVSLGKAGVMVNYDQDVFIATFTFVQMHKVNGY